MTKTTTQNLSDLFFFLCVILAVPPMTSQAHAGDDQNKMYVKWLEGNWGETNQAGDDVFGGCNASQNIDPEDAKGLTQKNLSTKSRSPGLLAFSSKGGTNADRVFVSSGYDHVNQELSKDYSLVQVWYDADATTRQIRIRLSNGDPFMNFHLADEIPGLPAYRTIIPIGNNVITLTMEENGKDSNSSIRRFKRCE